MRSMGKIETIIFWLLLMWWIGQMMGCASAKPNCAYPNQHSWCRNSLTKF